MSSASMPRRALLVVVLAMSVACKKERATPAPGTCAPDEIRPVQSITLVRTECYGFCPSYEVTIRADGSVTWTGRRFVDTKDATKKIDPAAFRGIVETASRACFFSLADAYKTDEIDSASASITVRTTNGDKSIFVHPGTPSSFPKAKGAPPDVLYDLASRIDGVAGTKAWIGEGKDGG